MLGFLKFSFLWQLKGVGDVFHKASLVLLITMVVVTNPQKVPPGVPPSQYQPPPPPPQQYQQAQQMPPQQMPPQQMPPQQMPPQQMQPQQVQYQQVPQVPVQNVGHPPPAHHQQQQGHGGHHDHHGQPQLLNTANLAEEKEHMQEHLNVNIDTSKMTEQELQFHYFKMHDADNNNKLDGCELIKSLIHWHDDSFNTTVTEQLVRTDEELSEVVDDLLKNADKNFDGYIDWIEFTVYEDLANESTESN